MELRRLLPLSGVAAVILVLAAVFIIGSTPGTDASGAKVASYYDSHQARAFVGTFVLAACAPFFVIFAAYLATALSPSEDRRRLWDLVLVAGSVLAAGAFVLTAFLTFALADMPDKVSGDALQALNILSNDGWVAFNSGLGVMMLGAAGSLLPRVGVYRVLGWVALVLGIALFIPFADFIALLASGLWIIVTSAMLFRERSDARYVAAPNAA